LRLPGILIVMTVLAAAAAFAADVPRPSPDFVITMLDGKKVNVAEYRGKVVALEILLTGCPHCQQASRTLSKLYQEYRPKGLQALGAAMNPDARENIPRFISENNVNFPVGIVSRDAAYAYLQQSIMAPLQMPQLVFIDRKGVIRGQYGGTSPFFQDEEKNMRAMIEKLLNESAPSESTTKKRSK
jgi:Glutathione peroxidase